jgi:hypothetical protein
MGNAAETDQASALKKATRPLTWGIASRKHQLETSTILTFFKSKFRLISAIYKVKAVP